MPGRMTLKLKRKTQSNDHRPSTNNQQPCSHSSFVTTIENSLAITMIKTIFLFALLLITASWAEEKIGSLVSQFDDGREDFLRGGIRFADLGTFTSNKGIFVQDAKVLLGQTKAYKATFAADVTKAIIGVEFWNDKRGSDVVLTVQMDKRRKPFLRGNVNTDTQCRKTKVYEESVNCVFDTTGKGEGTLYFWITGKRFTTYNIYVSQVSD